MRVLAGSKWAEKAPPACDRVASMAEQAALRGGPPIGINPLEWSLVDGNEAGPMDGVVELTDLLLERVETALDAAQGITPIPAVVDGGANAQSLVLKGRFEQKFVLASNIARPQLKFNPPPDNRNDVLFTPHLPTKPNAIVPLGSEEKDAMLSPSLPSAIRSHIIELAGSREPPHTPHPYHHEIERLVYPPSQLAPHDIVMYRPESETPLTWVDTVEKLSAMASVLSQQPVFAIDLEQHGFRSFQGFICLMQISTRDEDFLVDTLALRSQLHDSLLPVFTDPAVVKVMHGADHDIPWLQRDFSLYVVNMFDTGQAARVLEFSSCGLAYLLKHYCDVVADKRYQLADWRLRPLPDEMLAYARGDTHYLLYVYDRLYQDLFDRSTDTDLLKAVLRRSQDVCLLSYTKQKLTPTSHLAVYHRSNFRFGPVQLRVLAALYGWRDGKAREEDESTGYLLPNQALLRLSDRMPLDSASLQNCLRPLPPLVKKFPLEVVRLISHAQQDLEPSLAPSPMRVFQRLGLGAAAMDPPVVKETIAKDEAGSSKTAQLFADDDSD